MNHYFVLKKKTKKKNVGRVVVINWELHNLNLMSWAAILTFRCHCLPGTKLVNKGEKDGHWNREKKTAREGQSKLINKTRAWREELLCQNINISLPLLSLMWCEELIKGKCSSVPGVHPHNHVGSSVQHNQCSHTHINSSLLETNVMYQVIKEKAGTHGGHYNSWPWCSFTLMGTSAARALAPGQGALLSLGLCCSLGRANFILLVLQYRENQCCSS